MDTQFTNPQLHHSQAACDMQSQQEPSSTASDGPATILKSDTVSSTLITSSCFVCGQLGNDGGEPSCDNELCITRLVRRKSDYEGLQSTDSTSPRSRDSSNNSAACNHDVQQTHEKYLPSLGALGCIGKTLLAAGKGDCRAAPPQGSLGQRHVERPQRSSAMRRSNSHLGQRQEKCCKDDDHGPQTAIATNSEGVKIPEDWRVCCKRDTSRKYDRDDQKRVRRYYNQKGHASLDIQEDTKSRRQTGPVNTRPVRNRRNASDPKVISYQMDGSSASTDKSVDPVTEATEIDLEKGTGELEHVILSVQGMDCSGCESKLMKAIRTIPFTHNPRVSLVLLRAEFDVRLSTIPISEIIRRLEGKTGFRCERINKEGHALDILVPRPASVFLDQGYPDGVTNMISIDDTTVRVYFDATQVGARTLLKSFSHPVQLAPIRSDTSKAVIKKRVQKAASITLFSAILTTPVLCLAYAPLYDHEIMHGGFSLVVATILQIYVVGPFYPTAFRSLVFARSVDMDMLVVLSTSAAYIFSVIAYVCLVMGKPLSVGGFFESSTLLITLIMLGRFIGVLARQKAIESISITSMQPTTAILVDMSSGSLREVDARLLQYGDIFRVAPDSRIVTDGTVVWGTSEVNESMITEESKLIEKTTSSVVVAGSLNGSGLMNVLVNRLPAENTINTIAEMMDEAKLSKPRIQELANRIAGYFVPVIIILTMITFAAWMTMGIALRHQSPSTASVEAITYAIAVLIVSCPCAVGLVVPMVVVIAGAVAAEHGIVFKTAQSVQVAHKSTHVIFDKTGTLTQGKPAVVVEKYLQGEDDATAFLTFSLLYGIRHPVSAAVVEHLRSRTFEPGRVEEVTTLPGKGVTGIVELGSIKAGNSYWLGFDTLPQVKCHLDQGLTVFCVTIDDKLRAIYGLEDSVRPEAQKLISILDSRGITVSIVSGDDDGAVQSVASRLGIPTSHTRSRSLPSDKKDYVLDVLKDEKQVVIFCGDGTNDAAALAQATIGIQINERGTDVAQSAADVILMSPTLNSVLVLIDISRAAFLRIKFNFIWAFGYNVFAVLLAAGAFVNFSARIPPEYAGLGELVSVLPVIAIAVQLKYASFGPKERR